jgi:BCD family chlorophyll transporter-like MFS transporter
LGILAFGAWGMGYNFSSVSYLSLASEISGEKGRGKTIAVMWFMMITSIIVTSIGLGQLVDPYTPQALLRAFWMVGLAALVLGLVGLVRLESRSRLVSRSQTDSYSWGTLLRVVFENRQATLFFWYLIILLAAILGQDILLEPYGAEAFGLSVQATTRITSIWGGSFLAALLVAGILENRVHKRRVASWGGWGALFGFVLIGLSGIIISRSIFYTGVVLLGVGSGLSTVSNLSLMLDMTTAGRVGLFIGAWGMANAVSRLIGTILGGVVRDLVTQLSGHPVAGYILVFGIEAALLGVSLIMLGRIDVKSFRRHAEEPSLVERAAMASEV